MHDDVEWSVLAVDADTGEVLLEQTPDAVLRTASVAKLLLLTEVAARLDDARLDPAQPLDRRITPRVADSGLWHLMRADVLPLADVCLLVASVSDNWATNVLLETVGLSAVHDRTARLGMRHTALHDLVRDHRGPDDPPTLSSGTAREWATFLVRVHQGTLVNREVSGRLLSWMRTSVDHSMVASAWAEDPLVADASIANKTGTDDGIRADIGLVRASRSTAYAVLSNAVPSAQAVVQMRALARRLATGPAAL